MPWLMLKGNMETFIKKTTYKGKLEYECIYTLKCPNKSIISEGKKMIVDSSDYCLVTLPIS